MPYIKKDGRSYWEEEGITGQNWDIADPGDLNFLITSLCLDFLGEEPRYADFNEVIGALECAKLEMYRRAVAPYEDKAVARNGDLEWPYSP